MIQALYQWQMTGQDAVEIERQFLTDRIAEDGPAVDRGFFGELLHGVVAGTAKLDRRIEPLLDRIFVLLQTVAVDGMDGDTLAGLDNADNAIAGKRVAALGMVDGHSGSESVDRDGMLAR